MSDQYRLFLSGFRKTLPFQTGVIPFGMLYATLAVSAGFQWWLVLLFSMVVFAGASQLVFVNLFMHIGSPFQAVLGANVVNLRHMIYSAGVSPRFFGFPLRWRLLLSYLLTDQLYAFAVGRQKEIDQIPAHLQPWFFFGSGFCTWVFWLLSTAAGIFFGQLLPKSLNLEFAIPLMFMPMLFQVCKNRFAYITAVLSVLFVFLFQKIPFGLGVFFAILCASLLGFFLQKRVRP